MTANQARQNENQKENGGEATEAVAASSSGGKWRRETTAKVATERDWHGM